MHLNPALKSLAAQLITSSLPERQRLVENILARPPLQKHICQDGAVTLTLLHRVIGMRMQIELCQIEPGTAVINHAHPDVESIEVPVYGGGEFHIGHRQFRIADGQALNYLPAVIPRGILHGGFTHSGIGPTQFLSVQYWHRVPMTTVADDWVLG
jgi:quercetin dioxygenase-like cupin family protein